MKSCLGLAQMLSYCLQTNTERVYICVADLIPCGLKTRPEKPADASDLFGAGFEFR